MVTEMKKDKIELHNLEVNDLIDVTFRNLRVYQVYSEISKREYDVVLYENNGDSYCDLPTSWFKNATIRKTPNVIEKGNMVHNLKGDLCEVLSVVEGYALLINSDGAPCADFVDHLAFVRREK